MRVLFYQRYSDYEFGRVFQTAFERQGHTTDTVATEQGISGVEQRINTFLPDFILSVGSALELSSHLPDHGLPLVHYELDKVMRSGFFDSGAWSGRDFALCTYRGNVQQFLGAGAGRAEYLPFFPNARIIDGACGPRDYKYDVSFVGSLLYDNDCKWYWDRFVQMGSSHPEIAALFDRSVRATMEALLEEQQRYFSANRYVLPELMEQAVTPENREFFTFFRLDEQRLLTLCAKEAAHRQRLYFLEKISGLHLFGPNYSEAALPHVKYGGTVPLHEGSSGVFSASKINLSLQRIYAQDGLSDRVFNVMASGGFLLSDRNEAVNELFVEGEEIACFASRDEMNDKIAYYLAHDDEREGMAEAGRRKVSALHSVDNRVDAIVKAVGG